MDSSVGSGDAQAMLRRILLPLLCLLFCVSGCSTSTASALLPCEPPPKLTPADMPAILNLRYQEAYRPLERAIPSPAALSFGEAVITLSATAAIARLPRTIEGGMVAARDYAKMVADTRDCHNGEQLLSAVAAPSLDGNIRAHLVNDRNAQLGGTARHPVKADGGWFRVQPHGPTASLTYVRLEIAWLIYSEPLDSFAWSATRLDVEWRDRQGWKLSDYSDGRIPAITHTLSAAERQALLPGTGWTQLS